MCRSLVLLSALLVVSALLPACGGDSEAPGSASDSERESSDSSDSEASDLPAEVTIGALDGSAALRVQREPFAVVLLDADGEAVGRFADHDGAPAFGGFAMATATRFNANTFYHPALRDAEGVGRDLAWVAAVAIEAHEAEGDTHRFTLATAAADGSAGDPLTLVVSPGAQGVQFRLTLAEGDANVLSALSLDIAADEGLFGLGQQFDRVDNRGEIRDLLIQAEGNSESSTNEVHVPVPLIHSSAGWSLFVDSRWPGAVDAAGTREDRVRTTWFTPEIEGWIFVHPEPLERVRRYTAVTALPAPVPYWSLGPVWWRNRNVDGDEVLSDARRARENGLGGSLMWIDRPWQTYYQNFRFNPVQFPEPEAMFAELRSLGYRSLLHHSPQVNVPGTSAIQGGEDASERLYETYVENGWVVLAANGRPFIFPWGGGQGAFVDWSNPDAVAAVHTLIPRVADLGVVGVKMDWDEYLQPNIGNVRLNLSFHNGETAMTMKSWYSALYHKALLEGFSEAIGEQGFTLVRHGSPRDQQWSTCVWPGDLDNDFTEHTRGPSEMQRQWNVGGLPAAIVAQISLGLSGFPCFASDIGGYRNGQPTQENILRWMAFGIFNGVMQLGGGGRTHMPWSEDTPYDEEALRITRLFFAERMALVPYVHQQLRLAALDGTPLVRSLWMMHPDEPASRTFDRDFWFGPDFVVAPVYVEGATDRELWLPEGQWVDWLTGERRDGGRAITREVPLDAFAAHVRAGALVPLLPPEVVSLMPTLDDAVTAWEDARWMRLRVVPGPAGSLDLFNGLQATLDAHSAGAPLTLSVAIGSPSADVHPEIAFAPEFVVIEVELDGTTLAVDTPDVRIERAGTTDTLAQRADASAYDSGEFWWRSDDNRLLLVRLEQDAILTVR